MHKLTLAQINAAVDAAFQTALAQTPPLRVSTVQIGDNATLRTDTYSGPLGPGFLVVATIDLVYRKLTIARQHGPETWRERPTPSLASLLEEVRSGRAAAYVDPANACDIYELADAETKLASADPTIAADGATQKTAALTKRLQIKSDFPKPQ